MSNDVYSASQSASSALWPSAWLTNTHLLVFSACIRRTLLPVPPSSTTNSWPVMPLQVLTTRRAGPSPLRITSRHMSSFLLTMVDARAATGCEDGSLSLHFWLPPRGSEKASSVR